MKKRHVVIVTNNIDGGVGTFLNQMSSLQTNTRKISLLTLRKEINASLPPFSSNNSFSYRTHSITKIFQEFVWLKKQISLRKPDIIIAVDVHASLLICFLKIFFFPHISVIISNRNNIRHVSKEKLPFLSYYLLQWIGQYSFSKADKIVCVSKGLAQDFKDFFNLQQNITFIYNSIDLNKAMLLGKKNIEAKDAALFSGQKKTILAIGRLEKQKDFATLIQSIQLVGKNIKNIQLLIIGDGSQKEALQSMIEHLHLQKTVFLLGWRKNVYPYLTQSDLFVLSSHYEGFGYVLIEAMSQGIPIISTDCSFGPSEVLASGEYGILTPIDNRESMAKHIKQLVENKKIATYYAHQSKKRVSDFSQEKLLKKYADLLS